MAELDDIQDVAHLIRDIEADDVICANFAEKIKTVQEHKRILLKELKGKFDLVASHDNACFKSCPNRQKFQPKNPHTTDSGTFT